MRHDTCQAGVRVLNCQGTGSWSQTYTVNASAKAANGTWKLRVQDAFRGDTGYIDSWSLTV